MPTQEEEGNDTYDGVHTLNEVHDDAWAQPAAPPTGRAPRCGLANSGSRHGDVCLVWGARKPKRCPNRWRHQQCQRLFNGAERRGDEIERRSHGATKILHMIFRRSSRRL
ncbi:unnamed protein product [Pleuronectes platessa]|uniref:Uncharacterized protein n=1 Tax=Pleuronectes platessa TaxID=8262 RepID=A0A9N7YXS7_PLEPL|nr:unnamed protein product [Pleuronectes platessa]